MRNLLAVKVLCLAVAASWWPVSGRADPSIGASVEELPPPDGSRFATASRIADDGTAVGYGLFDDANLSSLLRPTRWRLGQSPDSLGGTLANYVEPRLSTDASVIVAYIDFPNPDGMGSTAAPAIWRGTAWEPLAGATSTSRPFGVSANGLQVTGSDITDTSTVGWRWSAATGVVTLPAVAGLPNSIPTAVSNDGSVTVGYATDYEGIYAATIWDASGVRKLLDGDGQTVGPAQACNSDCSVVVGGDAYGDGPAQAWRWTPGGGVQSLGAAPGAPAGARYVARGVNEGGSVVVGSWSDPSAGSQDETAFIWIADSGMQNVKDLLASNGVAYGANFPSTSALSISSDGRYLLLSGVDPDNQLHSARVTLVSDRIFADAFDD